MRIKIKSIVVRAAVADALGGDAHPLEVWFGPSVQGQAADDSAHIFHRSLWVIWHRFLLSAINVETKKAARLESTAWEADSGRKAGRAMQRPGFDKRRDRISKH